MTALLLLFALAFIVSVDVRIIAPVLPSISESLGATPGTVGLAMTTYAFAYGTGQLVYGQLSDRYGRVAVIRLAALGFSCFTALSALSGTAWQFIAVRLLVGAFAGAVIPLTLVFIGDSFEYSERQAVLGRFSVATSAGTAFSAAVGGTVAHFVSWRVMLLGYAALALGPALLLLRQASHRPPRAAGEGGRAVRFLDILADPRARLVYIAIFVEGFMLWGTVTYLGAFASRRHGLDQLAVGLLIALFGVGTMVGGSLMGPARRRFSENAVAGTGGTLMAVALLAIIPRWPWSVFAAAMLALGLGFVGLHTTLQLRGTELNPAARGKAFSLFAFNLFAGSALGTALLGRLVDAGLDSLMVAISATGLFLVGAGTSRVKRRAHR
ncbi:MAG TPA: MFS transporter [Methylomirabilota bacterium]|nr:MFS transporter [Methylomirabilota bacterium]